MNTQFDSIIRLRRDNDYNYKKIGNIFKPQKGEICLVDTADAGLRAVCGDGSHFFNELGYIDEFLFLGYFSNGTFYKDNLKSEIYESFSNKLYIDIPTGNLYYFDYNNKLYKKISTVPAASAEQMGVMKLYNEVGQNIDGTMTQKAISDELNDKVEIALVHDEEMLLFII